MNCKICGMPIKPKLEIGSGYFCHCDITDYEENRGKYKEKVIENGK